MADKLDVRRSEYVPWMWYRETVDVEHPKGHWNVHIQVLIFWPLVGAFHFMSDFSCSLPAFQASPFPPSIAKYLFSHTVIHHTNSHHFKAISSLRLLVGLYHPSVSFVNAVRASR